MTQFFDDDLENFRIFDKDNFRYRIVTIKKTFYHDFIFLNRTSEPRLNQINKENIIDSFEIAEENVAAKERYVFDIYVVSGDLKYRFVQSINGKMNEHSGNLINSNEIIVPKIKTKFSNPGEINCIVYYFLANRPELQTFDILYPIDGKINRLNYTFQNLHNEQEIKFFDSAETLKFNIFHKDIFDIERFPDIKSNSKFKRFPKGQNVHPFLGVLRPEVSSKNLKLDRFIKIPIFCSNQKDGEWYLDYYEDVIDTFQDNTAIGVSFFFLVRKKDEETTSICYMDEDTFREAINFNDDEFHCEDRLDRATAVSSSSPICFPYKKFPINEIIEKSVPSKYNKILVKSSFDPVTKVKNSTIFLLDQINYRLVVFNYRTVHSKKKTSNICFEGIYDLINPNLVGNKVLQLYLDNADDTIVIVTPFYIQKIAISSFCTMYSYSSCDEFSTCAFQKTRKVCENPKRKNSSKCSEFKNIQAQKMLTEEYMCNPNTNDICFTGGVNQKRKDLLCNENSCTCQVKF